MSNNFMIFNSKHIRSYTTCPNGVKNTVTNEVITEKPATIIETATTTYVINDTISVGCNSSIRVDMDKILDERHAKKSDYRPNNMRKGGYLCIKCNEIISQKICYNGVLDNTTEPKQTITNKFAVVVETMSKTYVINCYVENDSYDTVFVHIPLTNVIGSKNSKKADYIGL